MTKKPKTWNPIIGRTHGRLTIVARDPTSTSSDKNPRFIAKCTCGNTTIINKNILYNTKYHPTHYWSCGCWYKEIRESKKIDLAGKVIGKLKVLECINPEQVGISKKKYKCECVCGNVVIKGGTNLAYTCRESKVETSCGCESKVVRQTRRTLKERAKDLSGKNFGLWTVLKFSRHRLEGKHSHRALYLCQCECGTVKEVMLLNLERGLSRSCGCLPRTEGGQAKILAQKRKRINLGVPLSGSIVDKK